MATKNYNRFIYWGTILLALAFVVGGLTTFYLGWHTRMHTIEDMNAENIVTQDPRILLTYETGRAPEGVEVPTVTINTAELADAQARVIRVHTLIATGGKTYTEMDREDPNRALYITSLTLQDSLHMAHSALELSLFVMGVGVAFTGTGLGIYFLGLPIVRKVLAI